MRAPEYYVYLVSGNVSVKKYGKDRISLKQGLIIYKNDSITLNKAAAVTLIDSVGNFLNVDSAGVYNGGDLATIFTVKANEGLSKKYFKFIFNELLNPDEDFETFKMENVTGVWGGALRGPCLNRVFPTNGLRTSATSIVFKWHKTSQSSQYILAIYDTAINELLKMSVSDTLQHLDIPQKLGGRLGRYFWRVTSKDGTCEDEDLISFELLGRNDMEGLTGQLIASFTNKDIELQLNGINTLETHGFVNEAFRCFEQLVKENPGNTALRKSYVSFLLDYGFEGEAVAAWK